MSTRTKGVILSESLRPCAICQRDGRFHTTDCPLEIVYALDDVNPDDAPDFVHTWECFGKSAINKEKPRFSSFAQPLLLVKLSGSIGGYRPQRPSRSGRPSDEFDC